MGPEESDPSRSILFPAGSSAEPEDRRLRIVRHLREVVLRIPEWLAGVAVQASAQQIREAAIRVHGDLDPAHARFAGPWVSDRTRIVEGLGDMVRNAEVAGSIPAGHGAVAERYHRPRPA